MEIEDMAKLLVLVMLVAAITRSCAADVAPERNTTITHIKGFDGPLPFSLETGYVEVEEKHGVELFYYFIQSERSPQEDPLILWISGGPGCSGLNALFFEIGPLKLDVAGYTEGLFPRLVYFEDSWTKVSNVIFLDAPVGTGFSYAREAQGLNVSLTGTGRQVRVFLQKWLAQHPEFASNPLYIGGDSYSGLTVPVTALEVANHNPNGELNLKGYMVGNGLTDKRYDDDDGGRVPFMHGMGLISDELYEAALGGCSGDFGSTPPRNTQCAYALQAISEATSDINPMHILEPLCDVEYLRHPTSTSIFARRLLVQEEEDKLGSILTASPSLPVDCRASGYHLSDIWANDAEVREMLGIREGSVGIWRLCPTLLHLQMDVNNTIPYHRNLTQRGYRALVYNGDHDLVITFVGAQAWIRTLGYPVVTPWRPWYSNRQPAGFTMEYAYNLTFATVKGGGHMAPESRPKECLDMLQKWTSPAGRL